ncbi:uncharacterized protein LOC129911763 [Episyrphus balteatus]|uniref:uncharacterized protein LOC129911763 n=1 Tax=Episyrphus balteatus TaxID=286459 RepID=UPI0024867295|nr:uncharacterized protein LOC129911763 [Episyrphus balteatus]
MELTQCYSSFSKIQTVAKWAAVIGGIQAVSWIILSIISILLYLCIFNLDSLVSYGSITKFVLYEMYFRGNCELDPSPDINFEQLKSVDTVLNSFGVLIFACVYLGVSFVWVISSILLLTHVKKDNINVTIAVLCTWSSVTLITCVMDLALGVMFGIDFSRYQWKSYQYSLASSQAGPVNPDLNLVQLVSAEYSAIFMMVISLKGFVLWLINFGLMIYVFIGALVARDTVNDFINHTFNSTHITPIHAFEPPKEETTGFDNAAFVVEHRQHKSPVELNEESIKRAARMSTDNLQERRFRNIDSFEQYPPAKPPQMPLQHPGQTMNFEPPVPAPDYTPPMPRSNQNGQIRNTRYQ